MAGWMNEGMDGCMRVCTDTCVDDGTDGQQRSYPIIIKQTYSFISGKFLIRVCILSKSPDLAASCTDGP